MREGSTLCVRSGLPFQPRYDGQCLCGAPYSEHAAVEVQQLVDGIAVAKRHLGHDLTPYELFVIIGALTRSKRELAAWSL